jgi:hypothetical protein
MVRATRGGIRRRRARLHGRPFPQRRRGAREKMGEREKERKKKGVRWRPDEGAPLGSDPILRVMWPTGRRSVGGPRVG